MFHELDRRQLAHRALEHGGAGVAARGFDPGRIGDEIAAGADARIDDSKGVEVRVRAPSLVPGIPSVPVTATSDLGTGDLANQLA